MKTQTTRDIIEAAIEKTAEMNPQQTDGEWLEVVTAEAAHTSKSGTSESPGPGTSGRTEKYIFRKPRGWMWG